MNTNTAVQVPSKFGSVELQAMIITRAIQKERELAIVQTTLDALLEVVLTVGDTETITAVLEMRRNPQAILEGMNK